jgi:small neutral amino acid transporter SnatA (MarC family)
MIGEVLDPFTSVVVVDAVLAGLEASERADVIAAAMIVAETKIRRRAFQ